MRRLICLAGGVASGKTTLAEGLRATLPGAATIAFGDVVRRHTEQAGLEPNRANLQRTGLQLVSGGWPAFVGELIAPVGPDVDTLIVEGVRHHAAVDELRAQLDPTQLLLVYLDVPDADLHRRLAGRGEPESVLRHEVESEVASLRAEADLVLQSSDPVDELVDRVAEALL